MAATVAPGVEPITVRQFDAFLDAGLFAEDARIELIGGRIVPSMPAKQPHNVTVLNLADGLRRVLPRGFYVAEEKPARWGDRDRPMPDVAVVRGRPSDYPASPPGPSAIPLVVEVADTTYEADREEKWRRYAAARFPIYWIARVGLRHVEVYRDPRGRGGRAAFATADPPYGLGTRVPVVIDGRQVGEIPVNDIFAGVRARRR